MLNFCKYIPLPLYYSVKYPVPVIVCFLIQAARSFLKAELVVQKLKNPSYEEHLASATAAFQQAAKLQEEAGRKWIAEGRLQL